MTKLFLIFLRVDVEGEVGEGESEGEAAVADESMRVGIDKEVAEG